MAMTSSSVIRNPRPGSLYDVLDLILDKGLVIDAYVRVSLVGIELLTIDARVVVAGVDTYLRFAEAANRLDLAAQNGTGLPELVSDLQESGGRKKTRGALEGVKDSVSSLFGGDDDDDNAYPEEPQRERRSRREKVPARRSSSRQEERTSRRSNSDDGDRDSGRDSGGDDSE